MTLFINFNVERFFARFFCNEMTIFDNNRVSKIVIFLQKYCANFFQCTCDFWTVCLCCSPKEQSRSKHPTNGERACLAGTASLFVLQPIRRAKRWSSACRKYESSIELSGSSQEPPFCGTWNTADFLHEIGFTQTRCRWNLEEFFPKQLHQKDPNAFTSSLQSTIWRGVKQPSSWPSTEEKCSVKPGICFRLAPQVTRGKVNPKLCGYTPLRSEFKELQDDYPDVNIYFQKKAWFDTVTCAAYAKDFRKQTSRRFKLLGADNLSGQCTPAFKRYMKGTANTLMAYSPADCTDLCAVTALNIEWRWNSMKTTKNAVRSILWFDLARSKLGSVSKQQPPSPRPRPPTSHPGGWWLLFF